MVHSIFILLFAFLQTSQTLPLGSNDKRRNVLMVISDDLRPEISAYYDEVSQLHPYMHTPNLDRFASKSTIFKNSHCQYAKCGPSRTSFLTSRRPHTTAVYVNNGDFRTVSPTMKTLPQMFKDSGYKTLAAGKIFHAGEQDYPHSWDEPVYWPSHIWQKAETNTIVSEEEIAKDPLPDTMIADHVNQTLQELAAGDKPFFMAVGFLKPHLNFLCPERLLKHYPLEEVPIADNQYAPDNFPTHAWYSSDEFRRLSDIRELGFQGEMNETLPSDKAREIRRAYYCTVSHIDEEFGRLLQVLKDLGLEESTVISFSGDHGWQLGEHSQWGKETNFYLSTRTPLMIHVPGVTKETKVVDDLVEFLDLMPTLADAAGLTSIPDCPKNGSRSVDLCTEGSSLLSVLGGKVRKGRRAGRQGYMAQDKVAYTQYLHGDQRSGDPDELFMEYGVYDGRYHFTKVVGHHGEPEYIPDWDVDHGDQLYDSFFDPDENINVADKAGYEAIRDRMEALLYQGFPE